MRRFRYHRYASLVTTFEELERRARTRVAEVRDNPEGRYTMRVRFYSRWGGDPRGGPGLGRSELDFLRWEIERGVLNPPEQGGSPWWRAVNERLLCDAELAVLLEEELPQLDIGITSVRLWRHYLRAPSPITWYRAHNGSIVRGYLDEVDLAHAEPWSERVFLNVVLYRLLYAHGIVEGLELGSLGRILADPRSPSVDWLLDLPAFYPRTYALSKEDVGNMLGRGHSIEDAAAALVDDLFVLPQLPELYRHVAAWVGQPGLERLIELGKPCYPGHLVASPRSQPPKGEPRGRSPLVKKKIAILGGGPASLAAACELTSYPDWRERYDITVYQIGWRLGGKTACGVGPYGRIEERGIHIFQGWYHNAFRMVREAFDYAEAHHLSKGSPLQKWTDAFVPDGATLFTQQRPADGTWTNWPVLFPYNDQLPGEGGPPPLSEVLGEAMGLIAQLVLGSPYRDDQSLIEKLLAPLVIDTWFTPPWEKTEPEWWSHAKKLAERVQSQVSQRSELRWLEQARRLLLDMESKPTVSLGPAEVSALRVATSLFSGFVQLLRAVTPRDYTGDDRLVHAYVLAEFALANLRGLLVDVYDERTHRFHFQKINDYDYRSWLLAHGLPAELADCAPVRFIYCGAFHNQYQGKPGLLAADMGLRSLLASITYRGSLVWRLTAGTGGSLTAPVYKMLLHRGVKFEFFHQVQEVHWSPTDSIEAMTMGVQVELAEGRESHQYSPLVKSKGVDAWPTHPLYDQLDPEQARHLKKESIDLESPWANWTPVRTRILRRGVDFDDVILGIPVRETERICREIVRRKPSWQRMSEVRSTVTVGVQLWLRPLLSELGFHAAAWGMDSGAEPNSVIYADLFYSWTDMASVLPFEAWPSGSQPGQLSYYCGTWPVSELPPFSDHQYPAREKEKLIAYTREWLDKHMGWFFPKAIKKRPGGGEEFDLTLLVDPSDPKNARNHPGEHRLRSQWFVINAAPAEQYVLAWPGTDRYRLAVDSSGYRNLFLAGDWTSFGLNIGHVEGAVTSGLKAAQALLARDGQTNLRPVYADIGLPGAE